MPETRPSIFYVFRDEPFLSPTRGDRINELYFLQALAKHFDVFYNGIPFAASDENAGDPDTPIAPPGRAFDLHIVRNNSEFFLGLPSPKMTMAFPYEERVFAAADCLFTITERWREILQDWNHQPTHEFAASWYPDKIVEPKQLINIGQVPSAQVEPLPRDHPGVARYRLLFTNAPFVAGYFGRLDDSEHLPMLFSAFTSLAAESPDYVVALGSGSTKEIDTAANTVHVGSIDYDEIIYAVNACDVIISGEDPAKEWAGDRKVLEAVAAGVPALTRPWSARLEQLGADYPLYYTSADELKDLVVRLHTDAGFKASIDDHIATLRARLSTDEAADRLATEIRKVIPHA